MYDFTFRSGKQNDGGSARKKKHYWLNKKGRGSYFNNI